MQILDFFKQKVRNVTGNKYVYIYTFMYAGRK